MQYEHIKLFKEAGFQQSIHRIYLKFQNMIYIYISSFILNVSEPWSPYLESKFSDTDLEFLTLQQVMIQNRTRVTLQLGGRGFGFSKQRKRNCLCVVELRFFEWIWYDVKTVLVSCISYPGKCRQCYAHAYTCTYEYMS